MENWQSILNQIVVAMMPAIIALLGYLLHRLTKWIGTKIENEYARGLVERTDDLVVKVVRDVYQGYVKPLQETQPEQWNAATQAEANRKALDALKSFLGAKGVEELAKMLGFNGTKAPEAAKAIDKYLTAAISNGVVASKNAGRAASLGKPKPDQGGQI